MTDAQAHEDALLQLAADIKEGVLVTLKRDGRPQLSNVWHVYDPAARTLRISVTDDRAKTKNLRRDPRAGYHVTSEDRWAWTVVEGTAELTPVASDPHDETVEALIALYRDRNGEHDDWDDFRRAMVRDKRVLVTLHVERAYGQPKR